MPSLYTLLENEEYRLVRGRSTPAQLLDLVTGEVVPSQVAVAPNESVEPCCEKDKEKWICVEPDGATCPFYRGFNPQTQLIACTYHKATYIDLSEKPLDFQRLTVYCALLQNIQNELMDMVLGWREESITTICAGKINVNIGINAEFEVVTPENKDGF